MKSKQTTNIKSTELIADDKNFNKGSENGAEMIRKSFEKFGAGRSILLDKNNRIIAGNKSVEFSGLEDVVIVESDGTQLIAVKRTDIDLDSPQGREMALADNASAKANIVFDAELIEAEVGVAVAEEWLPKPNYAAGMDVNNMTDDDVDLEEEFDPIGTMDGKQRVVFLFDGPEEAESYLNSLKVDFKKMNMAWQVNLCTQSI
jgi:hypothetical protein